MLRPGGRVEKRARLGPDLSRTRVLDFTQYVSGPTCTRLLVELGADVIKLERPPYGDPQRGVVPRRNRQSSGYVQQNRGKRSISINLDEPDGLELVRRLTTVCDVVVENFAVGVLERRGLGYDQLRELNPTLVMASISGFGQTGPLSEKPAFDTIIQAYSGVMHITGDPDGPPHLAGFTLADGNAGVHAFAAIGYALYHRELTGEGCHIDIAMLDTLFHLHETAIHVTSDPNHATATRAGQHYATQAPAGAHRSPNGYIALFCTQSHIDRLWRSMRRCDLVDDPRFATTEDRIKHRTELTAIIESWMNEFEDDHTILERLDAERVPCGPVLDPATAADLPHFRHRHMVRDVHDDQFGTVRVPAFPIAFSNRTDEIDASTSPVGADNRPVLAELLGLTDDDIDALIDRGVIDTTAPATP